MIRAIIQFFRDARLARLKADRQRLAVEALGRKPGHQVASHRLRVVTHELLRREMGR